MPISMYNESMLKATHTIGECKAAISLYTKLIKLHGSCKEYEKKLEYWQRELDKLQ